MAGRFSQEFLDTLLARIDIVDLIAARVSLKKSGGNYVACCPFHSEKTPSFAVSRPRQFYHCFGCGTHGDAIAFVMAFDRLGFPEAVLALAESVGMPLPDDINSSVAVEEEGIKRRIFDVQGKAARFYIQQLKTHPEASKAIAYLKSRGISGEIAHRYRLGYAPPGWNNFPPGLGREDLRCAGLLVAKESSTYDRFRDRIMFPIRDRRGRIVGFGGRVLDDSLPKYLNSPETAVFKKSREVYGLYEALEASRKIERVVVVEGYMDVIALAQYGFPHAVATLGTATSADHVELLFRFVEELVFCFDGDEAGRRAAWKALQAVLPTLAEGRTVRFLTLPQGEDPDSLIRREGADPFGSRLRSAELLSDYFFSELSRNLSLQTIEGRTALIKRAGPLLQTMKPGPFRQMMRAKLGELTSRPSPPRLLFPRGSGHPSKGSTPLRPSLQHRTLALLVQNPRLATLVDETALAHIAPDWGIGALFLKLLGFFAEQPDAPRNRLVEHFRGTAEEEEVRNLLAADPLVPPDGIEAEFRDALRHLIHGSRQRRLEELIRQAQSGTLDAAGRGEMRRLMSKAEGTEGD